MRAVTGRWVKSFLIVIPVVIGVLMILALLSLTPSTWQKLDVEPAIGKFGAPLPSTGSDFAVLVHPRRKVATCQISESDFKAWAIDHDLVLLPLSPTTMRIFYEATNLSDSRLIDRGYFTEFGSVSIAFDILTSRASFSTNIGG